MSLIITSCLLGYFLSPNTRKLFLLTVFKTIMIGIGLWLVLIITIPYYLMDIANLQIRTTTSGRLDLWLYVLSSITEHPWFGYGPMSFTWAEGKPLPHAHPHNSVMQVLYEYGGIACVLFVVWVISRVYKRLNTLRHNQNMHFVAVMYALLSGLIYSLFSGVAVMPFAQLVLIFLVAMQTQYHAPEIFKAPMWTKIFMALFVTVGALTLLITYRHNDLQPALFPRVWINGLMD